MNEKEIKSLKEHIKTTNNNIFATFKVETISNLIIYYEELQKQNDELKEENERLKNEPLTNKITIIDSDVANIYRENVGLKNNWNELKEWLENELKLKHLFEYDCAIKDVIYIMQELEEKEVE